MYDEFTNRSAIGQDEEKAKAKTRVAGTPPQEAL
jgi:hypothetical protein